MPNPAFPDPSAPEFTNPWTDPLTGTQWSYAGPPKRRWNRLQGHAPTHRKLGVDPLTPADIGAATDDHTHTAADVGAMVAPLELIVPPVDDYGYPTPLVARPVGISPYVLVSATISVGPEPFTPLAPDVLVYAGVVESASVWTSDGNPAHPGSGAWWEVRRVPDAPSVLRYFVDGWLVSSWESAGIIATIDTPTTWAPAWSAAGVPEFLTAEMPTVGALGQLAVVTTSEPPTGVAGVHLSNAVSPSIDHQLIPTGVTAAGAPVYSSDGTAVPAVSGSWYQLIYGAEDLVPTPHWAFQMFVDGVFNSGIQADAGAEAEPWLATWPDILGTPTLVVATSPTPGAAVITKYVCVDIAPMTWHSLEGGATAPPPPTLESLGAASVDHTHPPSGLPEPLVLTSAPLNDSTVAAARFYVGLSPTPTDITMPDSGDVISGSYKIYATGGLSAPPSVGTHYVLLYDLDYWVMRTFVDGVVVDSVNATAGTEAEPWLAAWPDVGGQPAVVSSTTAPVAGTAGVLGQTALVNGVDVYQRTSNTPGTWKQLNNPPPSGGGTSAGVKKMATARDSRTNTVTLATDPELNGWPVEAGGLYSIKGVIIVNAPDTGGFKLQLDHPVSTSGKENWHGILRRGHSASVLIFPTQAAAVYTMVSGSPSSSINSFLIFETFIEFAESGTLSASWAQYTLNATPSYREIGSQITVERVN